MYYMFCGDRTTNFLKMQSYECPLSHSTKSRMRYSVGAQLSQPD